MMKKEKKPLKHRTKFAIAAVVNLTWYTIAVLILTAFDKTVPDSLTVSWFSAWTVELACLCGIKIIDKRKGGADGSI